ncbi:hypothetical protein OS493_036409 [Desmophyllum pertusum]|uniref:Uncharacterized protein n=1 Tax=Desmophyllum pertusum TaxID=174260 RepID=A0A9W9ZJ03_9CNID|nr:hypothetical protein OS493_036409 [Desmophyllum pertusum]
MTNDSMNVWRMEMWRNLSLHWRKKGHQPPRWTQMETTALHMACQIGNVECLEVLLEEQPDLSFVNKSGCSPLHVAAQSGNTECVKRILQHKVHVGTQDGRKMTALHHAGMKIIHFQIMCLYI